MKKRFPTSQYFEIVAYRNSVRKRGASYKVAFNSEMSEITFTIQ